MELLTAPEAQAAVGLVMSVTFCPPGLRVLKKLGEIPPGELYLAEYLDSRVEVELLITPAAARGTEPGAEAPELVHLRDQLHRAARVEHPNVARVCAVGETAEGALWATFEILHGEFLSEILSAGDVFPPDKAIDLVLQAASGLQAAHEVGLLHGDRLPDTILVTRTADKRAQVKLTGHGLVQLVAEPSVHSHDERSDVFSLGAVLQQLLTGAPPSADRDEALPIPEAARRVLAKALEPLPEDRFQTVAAFGRALATATSKPHARTRDRARRAGRLRGVLPVAAVAAIAAAWLLSGAERFKLGDAGGGALEDSEPVTTGEVRELPSDEPGSTPMPPSQPRVELVDVRSIDSTIQVDLRYATANNFTGAPLPGYEGTRALLRREPAAALGRVQAQLRSKGLGLRIFDAYRPVRASRAMVDWAERAGKSALLESGYIAPRSRHNLAVAVDLTVVDLATGTEVPLGTTEAPLDSANGDALRARQILIEAMESEGFSGHGGAWWHFNFPLDGAVPLDRVIR